jgi:2-oxoglutarate dehydrogenase E2 component (dihydrolipoamide succinyltransferase)
MARMNILLPSMGEGVIEATITRWLVSEGSSFKEDDPLVEIATDKVDSEIPAPSPGTLVSIVAREGSVARVGEVLAIVENEVKQTAGEKEQVDREVSRVRETIEVLRQEKKEISNAEHNLKSRTPSGKFLSPLVRSIAAREGISYSELDELTGTGMDGRITRDDVVGLLKDREKEPSPTLENKKDEVNEGAPLSEKALEMSKKQGASERVNAGAEAAKGDMIIPMGRVRKLIADHMVMSKRTSAHVTSFIDADVTRLVKWRNANKEKFLATEGQKLTLTPIFINATAMALYEFPEVNVSVEGDNIIRRKNINIGMATALPDGNLIVPVIKNADEKNLTGLAKAVNDLAARARSNKLKPDEITGGTFTVTNFGSYQNLAGTPIINQPQAAILGTGVVKKTPAVIETPEGDMIAIRHIMILSLSYDHRVIDGALAGKFLHKIKDILENFSPDVPW